MAIIAVTDVDPDADYSRQIQVALTSSNGHSDVSIFWVHQAIMNYSASVFQSIKQVILILLSIDMSSHSKGAAILLHI